MSMHKRQAAVLGVVAIRSPMIASLQPIRALSMVRSIIHLPECLLIVYPWDVQVSREIQPLCMNRILAYHKSYGSMR